MEKDNMLYKKIMNQVYGIGASIVILGALFKILHLPGAAIMLMVGLGTESFVFFISAFDYSSLKEGSSSGLSSIDSEDIKEASESTKKYTQSMQLASELINEFNDVQLRTAQSSVSHFVSSLETFTDGILSKGQDSVAKLSDMNTNLTSVNEAYRTSISSMAAQSKLSNQLAAGISDVKDQFEQSLDGTKEYKKQILVLSDKVGELNSIYNNMLGAMKHS